MNDPVLAGIERRIRRIADYQEIANLMASYSNSADGGWDRPTHDPDTAAALFTDDGEWLGAPFGVAVGRGEIRALFRQFRELSPFAFHTNYNPLIEIDGDTAVGEWHHLIFITSVMGEVSGGTRGDIIGTGIYTNDFVRTPAGWRIKILRARAIFMGAFRDGWRGATHLAR